MPCGLKSGSQWSPISYCLISNTKPDVSSHCSRCSGTSAKMSLRVLASIVFYSRTRVKGCLDVAVDQQTTTKYVCSSNPTKPDSTDLRCDVSELEKRVLSDSRIRMGKVRSVEGLHKNLERWNCAAVPRDNCVTVITDGKTASECAEEIIGLLHLSK